MLQQKKTKRLPLLNIRNTQYSLVKQLGQENNFKLITEKSQDCDIYWVDYPMNYDFLSKLKSYQKINYIPNIEYFYQIEAQNLNSMEKKFGDQYNFFPKTWIFPKDAKEFKFQLENSKKKTYILKPDSQSQGKGIVLFQKINDENITELKNIVVQEYINKPFLIDKLKFDLRIYILITGVSPLRIYMYREGMARFATEPYIPAKRSNIQNTFQHLTNYSINKNSPQFIFNDNENKTDIGHKRSFSSILQKIQEQGYNSQEVIEQIKLIIQKTLISISPYLNQCKTQFMSETHNEKFFHILGFDILLDSNLKPWLIEVNQSPSFTADTPFDINLKKQLIQDTFNILNLKSLKNRKQYYREQFEKKEECIIQQKKKLVSKEEKQQQGLEIQQNRTSYEIENIGNFVNVIDDIEKLQEFISFIQETYDLKYFGKQQKKEEPEPIKKITKKMSLNNVEKKHYSFDKNTVFKLSPKIKMNDFKLSEKIIEQMDQLKNVLKNIDNPEEEEKKQDILKSVDYISYSKYQSFKFHQYHSQINANRQIIQQDFNQNENSNKIKKISQQKINKNLKSYDLYDDFLKCQQSEQIQRDKNTEQRNDYIGNKNDFFVNKSARYDQTKLMREKQIGKYIENKKKQIKFINDSLVQMQSERKNQINNISLNIKEQIEFFDSKNFLRKNQPVNNKLNQIINNIQQKPSLQRKYQNLMLIRIKK